MAARADLRCSDKRGGVQSRWRMASMVDLGFRDRGLEKAAGAWCW